MDREESLINGPGVQPPASVNVPVPRDVTGDVLRRGVAQVGQNIDGMCREMVETEDSTKQFEQERILIQTQDEVGSEARRRLQLPDGDPDAFFDERGNFSKKALNNFASPYLKRLQGIGSGILNPDLARKMRFKAAVAGDKMLNDLFDSGKEVARKKQETALNSSLKLAEETNNWGWYEDLVHEGVRAGAIDSAKGQLLIVQGRKSRYANEQENLKTALFSSVAADPIRTAAAINKGLYNDLNPIDLDRAKREVRRRLADEATPAPLSAEDRRKIQEKNIEALKKQLPNGATEQMWRWARNAQKNGGRFTERDKVEIRGAFNMELDKLPVPQSREEANQIAERTAKKWALLGAYEGNQEYIRAVVMDKMISRLDAAKGARRNDIGLVLRHIPDDAYIPNRSASVRDAYRKGDQKKIQEKEAARNLIESQIDEYVRVQMAYWRDRNPEASIHDDRMQIFRFAAKKAKELHEYEHPEKLDVEKKSKEISRAFDSEAQVGDTRERMPDSGKDFIDRKNREWKEYQKKQVPYTPQVEVVKDSAPLAVPMSFVAGRRAGAYVPKEMYQQLVQKYGSRPCLKATMDQSKAYNEVPVVGI